MSPTPCSAVSSATLLRSPAALALLLTAHAAARNLNQPPTDFACQLPNLLRSGVTETDLRALVSAGLAAHLTELTTTEDARRHFREAFNLRFSEASCFLLTTSGLTSAGESPGDIDCFLPENASHSSDASTPHYDQERRTLLLGEQIVKRFRVPAINQEMVLCAFEEEGWPPHIFDPLPPTPGIDPKKRLRDVTYRLNTNQHHGLLAFEGDGTSKGVLWRQI